MTRFYYWISYDYTDKKYYISGSPCIKHQERGETILSIIRDIDFSGRAYMGKNLRLKLISIEGENRHDCSIMVLNHFNTNDKNDSILTIKTIDIKVPKEINDLGTTLPNDPIHYKTDNLDLSYSRPSFRYIDNTNKFSITFSFRKDKNGDLEKYLIFTHPCIKINCA